jgi:hypothetical protein
LLSPIEKQALVLLCGTPQYLGRFVAVFNILSYKRNVVPPPNLSIAIVDLKSLVE